jgi:hypothetical protein
MTEPVATVHRLDDGLVIVNLDFTEDDGTGWGCNSDPHDTELGAWLQAIALALRNKRISEAKGQELTRAALG